MKLTNLNTKFLGQNNFYYKEIDSTQDEIWRLYEKNSPSGTLVSAGIQTKGKGTHGRKWYTSKENNIAFSFFITMDCDIKKLDGLTIKIAEIVTEIFKNNYRINLDIKEPNDIVYNGKKIGGILTQTKTIKEKVKVLAIGIGINTSKTEFEEEIKDIATSIKKEFNIDVNVEQFIKKFCEKFEKEILQII